MCNENFTKNCLQNDCINVYSYQKCTSILWQEIMHIYQVPFSFPPEHKAWFHFLAFLIVRCFWRPECWWHVNRRGEWSFKASMTKKWDFPMVSFLIIQLQGEFSKDFEQSWVTRWEGLGFLNDFIRGCMTRNMSPGLGHEQWMNFLCFKPLRLWVSVSNEIATCYLQLMCCMYISFHLHLLLKLSDLKYFFFFFFYKPSILFIYLFIYFWLCWVFGSCEGLL